MNCLHKILKLHLLPVFCFLCLTANVFAQEETEEPQAEKQIKNLYVKPVIRGFSLHADIVSPFMGIVAHRSVRTAEIHADINLFDKIFPTLEAGFGSVNATLSNGSSYSSGAPFFRLGFNYNLLKNVTKEGTPRVIRSYPFIGVRYGFEIMPYRIDNVLVTSDYWGESDIMNFGSAGVYAGWMEIVGGVRVDIAGGFTMGWNVRLKTAFHSSKDKPQLWYAAGYGLTGSTSFSFNYTLGYTFKIKEKTREVKKE